MKINPCIEKLSDMDSVEGGRFCHSCSKTIVDLTAKSNDEIMAIYEENRGELCGIVKVAQLQENRYYHPLKRFALALIIVFGTSLFVFANQDGFISFQKGVYAQLDQSDVKHSLTGFVYGVNGPLVAAEISCEVNGQVYTTQTDVRGEFLLGLPEVDVKGITVVIAHAGYETAYKLIEVKVGAEKQFIGKITLSEEMEFIKMGEIEAPQEMVKGKIAPENSNCEKDVKKGKVKKAKQEEKAEIQTVTPPEHEQVNGGIAPINDRIEFD
ncbi:MAG: carboxypeptidase regulatory-like domain-containing protein [Flavobacteriales bacterium]|nr:carboxypeptidase regulatory-like domain-containing protein [Flavobacteriales bacterium]MCB9198656.1 carboxypeptidase regulatory-like domain-containing protein [Flavobacteriales bacterium]